MRMTYVLCGANWFGIKSRLDSLRQDFVKKHGELSVETIDGEEAANEQIQSALESLPFLASQKMVIVQRLSKNKAVSERVDELLEKADETTTLILVEPEIDKRSSYYKTLKKSKGGFEEYKELDDIDAAKWLIEQASRKGGQLSHSDARYIIELVGINQQKLVSEVGKLVAYSKEITRETIQLLIEPTPQSSVFSLLDAVFAGDLPSTLKLYEDQRTQGVEPLNIVGMLAWQLHAVALARAAKGKSPVQISQQTGLKPFVLQKSQGIAARLDGQYMQKFLDNLLDLDIKFKTTPINQDTALKNLFAQLS